MVHDYIGIYGDNFVELTSESLDFCRNFQSLYICDDLLLLTEKSPIMLQCWDFLGHGKHTDQRKMPVPILQ